MENLQQTSEEELLKTQTPWDNDWGQVDKKYSEEEYKNLQAAFTKANQDKINTYVRLVEKDKKEILNIEDKKLQNKVIKELYWLDNIEELKLIHWDKFLKEDKSEDDELTDIERLNNELKLLKHNQAKWELEKAIADYKKDNTIIFEDSTAEDKLREELRYISSELSINERINRASKIAFWINNIKEWYRQLQWTDGWYVAWWKTEKEQVTEVSKEIWNIFSKYRKNK
jgi:hypothetical protein